MGSNLFKSENCKVWWLIFFHLKGEEGDGPRKEIGFKFRKSDLIYFLSDGDQIRASSDLIRIKIFCAPRDHIWGKFLEYVISLSSQRGFEREKRSRDSLVVAGFSVWLQK
jgi:hypothetical protein